MKPRRGNSLRVVELYVQKQWRVLFQVLGVEGLEENFVPVARIATERWPWPVSVVLCVDLSSN